MFLRTLLNWFLPIRLYDVGGGGGGTTTQVRELPAWAQPWAENLLKTGMEAINQPVQTYEGMRVAPMDQWQDTALSAVAGRAASGSPDEFAARAHNIATQTGQYLGANPYAGYSSPYQSEEWLGMENPWATMENPYLSEPYTQNAINQNAQSMARAYSTGTAAQLDSAAGRARAFGNTGYQQAVGQNEQNLGNAIGTMANQYQLGKTQLAVEDEQQRRLLGSADVGERRNLGVENALERTKIGATDWMNERANMITNNKDAQAGSLLDYNNLEHLYKAGGIRRDDTQRLLDQEWADYERRANAPFESIDRAGNLLGMAIGNTGQSTSSGGGDRMSQIMQLLGLGIGGYGALRLP